MAGKRDMVLTMNCWDYETAKKYRLGQKVVNIPGVGVDFSRFDQVSPDCREKLRKKWGIPEGASGCRRTRKLAKSIRVLK